MTNASRDNNNNPAIIGVSDANGTTILRIEADSSTHGLIISDGTTGTDFGGTNASKDENNVSTLLAISSVDGTTPIEIYVDSSTNGLLVKST